SPTSSVPLEDVTTRIQLAYGFAVTAPDAERDAPSPMACPHCGGHLIYRMMILPQHDRLLRGSPAWPSARPLQEVSSG
ncbi:MAG TPA: hypothetical protein VN444_04900, partial [Verrucomicrobiae bacterium]|nr:hypothetical protein [Verrucomicrobiae bacterium]